MESVVEGAPGSKSQLWAMGSIVVGEAVYNGVPASPSRSAGENKKGTQIAAIITDNGICHPVVVRIAPRMVYVESANGLCRGHRWPAVGSCIRRDHREIWRPSENAHRADHRPWTAKIP